MYMGDVFVKAIAGFFMLAALIFSFLLLEPSKTQCDLVQIIGKNSTFDKYGTPHYFMTYQQGDEISEQSTDADIFYKIGDSKTAYLCTSIGNISHFVTLRPGLEVKDISK